MKNSTPTPYSLTQKQEILANTIFESLIDHNRLVSHISRDDKRPNIDGEIVIVNEVRVPINKLEVQIKKLPEKNTRKPRIQCPISLFEYANTTTLQPVYLR